MDDRDENVTQARRYVRRDLGSDLEQKASDEFCLAMAERLPTPPARRAAARDMFESLSGAPAPVRGAIVLEFDETLMSTTRARATGRLGGRQAAIEAGAMRAT